MDGKVRANAVDTLLARLDGAVAPIWVTVLLRLGAPPRPDGLRAALRALVRETPRLHLRWHDPGRAWLPAPRTDADADAALVVDEEPVDDARAVDRAISEPIDLSRDLPLRLRLARVHDDGAGPWLLAVCLHHAVGDAKALGHLLERLWQLHPESDAEGHAPAGPLLDPGMTDAQVLRAALRRPGAALRLAVPKYRLLAHRAVGLRRAGDLSSGTSPDSAARDLSSGTSSDSPARDLSSGTSSDSPARDLSSGTSSDSPAHGLSSGTSSPDAATSAARPSAGVGAPMLASVHLDLPSGTSSSAASDIFFAAVLATAAAHAAGDGRVRLRVPVDLRPALGLGRPLGNGCSAVAPEFTRSELLALRRDPPRLAALARARLRALLDAGVQWTGALECMAVAALAPAQLLRRGAAPGLLAGPRTNTLVVTFLGSIDRHFAGAPLQIRSARTHTATWGVTGFCFAGRLTVNVAGFTGLWSRAELRGFARDLAAWTGAGFGLRAEVRA